MLLLAARGMPPKTGRTFLILTLGVPSPHMKLLLPLVAFLTFSACLAQTVSPDLDLSKAKESEIVKVAQSDAKEFYQRHKSDNHSTTMDYATGRAIKHGLLEATPQKPITSYHLWTF
jgi:hypothetical protein